MPITDEANIMTCSNNVNLHTVQGTSTSSLFSHSQQKQRRWEPPACCNQLQSLSVLSSYISLSRMCRRYTEQEDNTKMPSHMHQGKRKHGAEIQVPHTNSVQCRYQSCFQDFSAQLLTACEAGYHMMPHMCRTSSQTPFVLPVKPLHN